ncbi:hypothetical protein DAPPUDRAFT_316837 [Daphnia pulex]|uniref:Uncharacterized protein n=1 Tax=Daphnia pulex TaxID=6669 RepID=E9GE51_DAPPU|nr:hypothetical protein DAPPUDRAFT_316837 [Daphnia pulex]|eukprot:EFX82372.1 hypothetical protein DAPPUDRAFT_316837 [Daphnia pulex]
MTRRLTIVLVVLFGLLALASSGPLSEDDTNSVAIDEEADDAIEEELARAFQVANDVTDVAGYRQSRNQEQETSEQTEEEPPRKKKKKSKRRKWRKRFRKLFSNGAKWYRKINEHNKATDNL